MPWANGRDKERTGGRHRPCLLGVDVPAGTQMQKTCQEDLKGKTKRVLLGHRLREASVNLSSDGGRSSDTETETQRVAWGVGLGEEGSAPGRGKDLTKGVVAGQGPVN